jgi:hypothetical protein
MVTMRHCDRVSKLDSSLIGNFARWKLFARTELQSIGKADRWKPSVDVGRCTIRKSFLAGVKVPSIDLANSFPY